ncbi:response regulator [Ruminococcaceae bacterium OttesenSCG-928-I18]|nr:response regulator [Ruminococcaceae bacterium OttesenSCG-928-I18]
MENSLQLLMTETSSEICQLCKVTLPARNIEVNVCDRNRVTAYQELLQQKPDAVLLDVFMPGMDAMSLKTKYDENNAESTTQFYATGTFQNEEIEKEVMESGFSFYFLKPFDVQNLATRILQNNEKEQPRENGEILLEEEDMVTDMLRMIGVPAHIKGYRFLRESVL